MELKALIKELPGKLVDCIWHHLEKADNKVSSMKLTGDLNIDLTVGVVGIFFTVPLNYAIKVEEEESQDKSANNAASEDKELDASEMPPNIELDVNNEANAGAEDDPVTITAADGDHPEDAVKNEKKVDTQPTSDEGRSTKATPAANKKKGRKRQMDEDNAEDKNQKSETAKKNKTLVSKYTSRSKNTPGTPGTFSMVTRRGGTRAMLPTVRAVQQLYSAEDDENEEIKGEEEEVNEEEEVTGNTCTICDKTFPNNSYLKDHMFIHDRKSKYCCEVCSKPFIRLWRLQRHMRSAHPEAATDKGDAMEEADDNDDDVADPTYEGSRSPSPVSVASKDDESVSSSAADSKKQFQCPNCPKSFRRTSDLHDHSFVHSRESAYVCNICTKPFLRAFRLKRHMLNAHGVTDFTVTRSKTTQIPKAENVPVNRATPNIDPEKQYVCDICFKGFSKTSNLKDHMFTHSKESAYKCKKCNLSFLRAGRLKRHLISVHNEPDDPSIHPESSTPKTYTCSFCTEEFQSRKLYLDHVALHRQEVGKECDLCSKQFLKDEDLVKHKFLRHGIDQKVSWMGDVDFKCEYCHTDLKGYSEFSSHMTESHGSMPADYLPVEGCVFMQVAQELGTEAFIPAHFNCTICSDFSGTRNEAEEHIKEHASVMLYSCEYCDQMFFHIGTMRSHIVTRHDAERLCQCTSCDRIFTMASSLTYHTRLEHKDISCSTVEKHKYTCTHCNKTFPRLKRLDDHIAMVHLQTEPAWPCSVCGKKFKTETRLKEHSHAHTKTGHHVCDRCGKTFRRPHELLAHRHEDDPWRCSFCDATFISLMGFKLHLKKHTAPPGFMCKYCGKTFYTKLSMENHERSLHTHEHPFKCEVCETTFSNHNVYNSHMRTHKGGFPCLMCAKVFVHEKTLQRHMESHVGPRGYECNVCGSHFLKKHALFKHKALRHYNAQEDTNTTDGSTTSITEQDPKGVAIHQLQLEDTVDGSGEAISQQVILFQCKICFKLHETEEMSVQCERSHSNSEEEVTQPQVAKVLATGTDSANNEIIVIHLGDQEISGNLVLEFDETVITSDNITVAGADDTLS